MADRQALGLTRKSVYGQQERQKHNIETESHTESHTKSYKESIDIKHTALIKQQCGALTSHTSTQKSQSIVYKCKASVIHTAEDTLSQARASSKLNQLTPSPHAS